MRPIEILLVEDNPGDILITQEAFREAKLKNTLHIAQDGEEALAFLEKRDGHEDVVRPDLIFLDLNLPKIDGQEVLNYIKTHDDLKRIPVVVLTSSEAEQDVLKSYDLHANSYVVKPLNLDQFIEVIKALEIFWFSVVTLPSSE